MPDDLGEMVAVVWKPDCRGLTSEWVERKWRQRGVDDSFKKFGRGS